MWLSPPTDYIFVLSRGFYVGNQVQAGNLLSRHRLRITHAVVISHKLALCHTSVMLLFDIAELHDTVKFGLDSIKIKMPTGIMAKNPTTLINFRVIEFLLIVCLFTKCQILVKMVKNEKKKKNLCLLKLLNLKKTNGPHFFLFF